MGIKQKPPPNKGFPASKQSMINWVVEAISLAYESASQPSVVRSHSTRSMAASKALISVVALQEVFTAHIHQILFFGPLLYSRFPSTLVLVLLFRFHTGQSLVAMVVLYWSSPSVRINTLRVPLKGKVASPAIPPSCL